MLRKMLALLLTALVGVGILVCTPASAAPIIYAGDPVVTPSTNAGMVKAPSGMHSLQGTPAKIENLTISDGVTTMSAQRVSYNVTCNGKPTTVWGDFERSGTARRGVRGGFSRGDYTLTFGRLGVVSSGAGKVTDVRFGSPVIAGSGYSQGGVGTASNTWVQVTPWPWGVTTIGKACNGGLGYVIPAPAS